MTKRIKLYAKGFLRQGIETAVLCLVPTEKHGAPAYNFSVQGVYHGIIYEYTSGRTQRSKHFFGRRVHDLWGIINGCRRIVSYHQGKKLFAVLLMDTPLFARVCFWLVTRLVRTPYVLDITEFPLFVRHSPPRWRCLFTKPYLRVAFRLFDGIVVITEALGAFLKAYARTETQFLQLSTMVDLERFTQKEIWKSNEMYMAYCGLITKKKDGVDQLMKAFAIVSAKYPDLKLYLIGEASKQAEIIQMKMLAEEFGITEKVVFVGRVVAESVPGYLCGARLLALARPASIQAQGGFPSKVGEYLCSGRPVVVTKTGEIQKYLTDNETAFLVEPDNVVAFAEKLDVALSGEANAQRIGVNGREVAKNEFDYVKQTKRMVEFIEGLRGP